MPIGIWTDVRAGCDIQRARKMAEAWKCDFVLFNDRLIPVHDNDWELEKCPVVSKAFLVRPRVGVDMTRYEDDAKGGWKNVEIRGCQCCGTNVEEVNSRDEFAKAALLGLISTVRVNLTEAQVQDIADGAYLFADAMLRARTK